jgi:hyperosmotically inducible periplasmic protein
MPLVAPKTGGYHEFQECIFYKEISMTTKLATVMFVAGTLLAPAVAYAADTQSSPSGTSSRTETVKESVEDATITTKIKTDFAVDKQVSALNIHVDTDKGVVTLSGNAKTKEEADKAVSIAKNTKGVTSVKNDIKVGASTGKY